MSYHQVEMALVLSHHTIGQCERKTWRSCNNIQIHATSAAPTTSDLYLASVEERETVGYFLEAQVMRLLPRKTKNLVVECQSTGLPAQSTSVKTIRCIGPS